MFALAQTCITQLISGNYAIAQAQSDNVKASWCSGPNRQNFGRRRHLHRSDPRIPLEKIDKLASGMAIRSGTDLWGA
jgi:hypothetical protein